VHFIAIEKSEQEVRTSDDEVLRALLQQYGMNFKQCGSLLLIPETMYKRINPCSFSLF
jgi:urease accessory protein UreE